MDVKLLRKSDETAHESLFEGMYRQRHEVFAVELGWTHLRSNDGRDVDAFDGDDAHYLVAHDGEQVHGSLRLLPAWRRSMLLECWPEAASGDPAGFDPSVWEWTRWCPGLASRPRHLLATRRALILAALHFGRAQQASRFVTLCETKFVDQLTALGWDPRALGPEIPYPEGVAVGVGWELRPNALLETAARLDRSRPRVQRDPTCAPLARAA